MTLTPNEYQQQALTTCTVTSKNIPYMVSGLASEALEVVGMRRELPILFNTQMVKAILSGQKTVTRRPLKHRPLPKVGDVLWVRETFIHWGSDVEYGKEFHCVDYRADYQDDDPRLKEGFDEEGEPVPPMTWSPSIHMPRKFARILLEVTDVAEEDVLDITEEEARSEGFEDRLAFLKAWFSIYYESETRCHVIRFKVLEVKR